MTKNPHLVFVYGTLKTGQPNHYLLRSSVNGKSRLLGRGKMVTKYPLVIASKYNIPFLLDKPGSGRHVTGEIYELDDAMLHTMDKLEEHPSFYERVVVPIQMSSEFKHPQLTKDCQLSCWVYFLRTYTPEFLKLDFIEDYDTNGSHSLPYDESEQTTCMDDILVVEPQVTGQKKS